MSKKQSFFGTLLIILGVVAFFVGFIFIKHWYYERKHHDAVVAWKGTAYEWVEKVKNDSTFGINPDKYLEIEGVLLNVATTQGATTVYFTSGFQTDTSYLVGQQPDWLRVEKQTELTACDSLIKMYGRQYNFQPAPVQVIFSGDVVNRDSDSLLIFSYFKDCDYTIGKSHYYQLQNFCAQKVKVRTKIKKMKRSNEGWEVELDEVMILSKGKNKIKFQ